MDQLTLKSIIATTLQKPSYVTKTLSFSSSVHSHYIDCLSNISLTVLTPSNVVRGITLTSVIHLE